MIIPAMATTGAKLNQGGPGLLFIYLPNLIKSMPGGRLIIIIFFVAVLFGGLTSLINLYEAPIATVQEKLHVGRKAACMIIGAIGLSVSLLIQGIVSGWMDVLSIYICRWEQDWQRLCFSGYVVKNTWRHRLTKEEQSRLQNLLSDLQIFVCGSLLYCADSWNCVRRYWII